MRWTLLALVVACGGSSERGAGEECVSSSQCAAGLVCDFGVTPHVCSMSGTPPPPDGFVDPTDASPDQPDAPPNQPDAPPGTPDARPPPDGPPPPDAPVPDAMIDAM